MTPVKHQSGAKARAHFAIFLAPFDFAQGRLLKSCPFKHLSPGGVFSATFKARVHFASFSAPFDYCPTRDFSPCSVAPTGLIAFFSASPGLRPPQRTCPGLFSTAPSGSEWAEEGRA
jgi:hypothetical protein